MNQLYACKPSNILVLTKRTDIKYNFPLTQVCGHMWQCSNLRNSLTSGSPATQATINLNCKNFYIQRGYSARNRENHTIYDPLLQRLMTLFSNFCLTIRPNILIFNLRSLFRTPTLILVSLVMFYLVKKNRNFLFFFFTAAALYLIFILIKYKNYNCKPVQHQPSQVGAVLSLK